MDYIFSTPNASIVSREHSLVEFKNNRMYITNLSKTNPTFLNDDKVNNEYAAYNTVNDLDIFFVINIQQVIRQTEVEEGDFIGFGSKPKVKYPDFSEDQIFIYECKCYNKSKQQKVIIVDDSDEEDQEDDDIEIIEDAEDEIIIDNTPNDLIDAKDESSSSESSINELDVIIEKPPQIKLNVEHPKVTISDTSLHIDTVESINDLSYSDSEESSKDDDEDVSDHLIKAEDMLNVKIMLKKLTELEMEKWRPKIEMYNSAESSESDFEDVGE